MSDINSVPEANYPPVYPVPNDEDFINLTKFFKKKYDAEPDFYARAPGRVNLIGEHVDYCGYSVCPMAVQQHILVAIKVTDDSLVKISNVDETYNSYECLINEVDIPENVLPDWHLYFLCGVKGVLERLPEGTTPRGFRASVFGNIPLRSGLSSSSAMVCAATLALCNAYNLSLTKEELAELAAKSERYIGTQGGGMDQAISFLAKKGRPSDGYLVHKKSLGEPTYEFDYISGCAKYISFDPLRSTDLKLPDGAVFVIAHSLIQMNKAATLDFNCRVVECRLACQILAKRLRLDWKRINKLAFLQKFIGLGVRHLRALATETLHNEPYTKDEICKELQITKDELDKASLTENTKHLQEFKLKQRMLHVTEEVERVLEFNRICKEAEKGTLSSESALYSLGNLMKKSHESLKTLYECSHEELDKIIKLSEGHTLGARLTGAGWGGCTVALTSKDKMEDYIETLKEEFYRSNERAEDLELDNLVFATEPGSGAAIFVKS
ncbi:hypothetical protein RUM44_009609 [Polyplax serrata]|uniref:Galactokinase n=1 Tax=Polyplax serrata TaxID=468196 RepID=A0ABR1AT71_POLSC